MAKHELPETNGAVAYNVYDVRFDGNIAVQPKPPVLPDEKPEPQRKKVVKAKLVLSPFAIVGMAAVVVLLAMVIYGYVQFYEASNRAGELREQLSALQEDTGKLRSAYESRINLAQIEQRAKELGMSQPSARQSVYLNIPGADHTEIIQADDRSFVEKAWDAITSSFSGILEYFR